MNLPVSFRIASRYARGGQKGKFVGFIALFSMAGITLGVAALIIVVSVMDGFEGLLKERLLGAVPQVSVYQNASSSAGDSPATSSQFKSDVSSAIKNSQFSHSVSQVFPLVESQGIMQMPGNLQGVMVQGLADIESVPIGLKEYLIDGDWSQFFATRYGVFIGRYQAIEHGLRVGDKVRIIVSGASHYTPLGRMPAQRNFTVLGMFETESDIDRMMVFSRAEDLNRLLKQPKDSVHAYQLVLNDAFEAPKISVVLSEQLGTDYKVENWQKTHGKLFSAVKMEKTMMWLMLSLIIAVAAFNIVSALVMMVTKKQNEVAILKTQGMRNRNIAQIFTLQGAFNGLIGTLIGVVLGAVITLNLNSMMLSTGVSPLGTPGIGLPIEFSWFKVALIAIFAVVLALLASIYPAKRAANLKPADVLRYE